MKSWLRTWLLFVALGYPAGFLILLVHEAIGHGVVAELLGGRFLSLYLSPAVGWADFFAPSGARSLAALGTAAPLAALVGLAIWTRTRRSQDLLPRVAGWYFGLAGVSNLAYWGLFPWLLARRGSLRGDWAEVWQAWGVRPLFPALLSLLPLAIVSALLLVDARRLVDRLHPAFDRGVSGPFALLATAGAVPKVGYILAYWPWWRTLDQSLLGGLLVLPVGVWIGGLIGLPIARWRGWD
ncbi:MAG TPA: hypothetical protein VJV75_13200, partial [Candidatus Polarisedimenticolia bacterium]|nr:hypothetical protein [Candidatus Polarisedimenticolia bacterium]